MLYKLLTSLMLNSSDKFTDATPLCYLLNKPRAPYILFHFIFLYMIFVLTCPLMA
jgi:hypothetical protein